MRGAIGLVAVLLAGAVLFPAHAGAGEDLAAPHAGGRSAEVGNAWFSGRVHDNVSNRDHQGSGFRPLAYHRWPEQNLFRDDAVGLNFEHVFNGTAADRDLAMFTPRWDACRLIVEAPDRVTLHWPAADSSWDLDCWQTYQLVEDGVEITFRAVPRSARYPMGYVAMMWASYMNRSRARTIHFYGEADGVPGWQEFGVDLPEGIETGTVAFAGAPPLPHEEGAQLLNLVEHPTKKFLLPFYYGLVDGDGDLGTEDDTMAYVMMFDQKESIRFALWNFIRDADGKPDPHSPAWDWQFVIHNPQPNESYQYRARVAYVPYEGRDAVRARYEAWAEMGSASDSP